MKRIFLIFNFAFLILDLGAGAQIQQAWVAHYNNGIPNGNHQALKIALDSSNNIYICGFSQNTNGGTGYVTLKYAPNGNPLWVFRFDSNNVSQATPASFVVDVNNNAVVTGNAGTMKCDANGDLLWSNSYAGLSIATDTNANVFITGFGSSFNTVKLAAAGTNLWSATYRDVGPTVGESIVVDAAGDAYVLGLDVYAEERFTSSQGLLVIKYSPGGAQLWEYKDSLGGGFEDVMRVTAAVLDCSGNAFVLFDGNNNGPYTTDKIASTGSLVWQLENPTDNFVSSSHGIGLASNGTVGITGQFQVDAYGTYGIAPNGDCMWTNVYPTSFSSLISSSKAIDVDGATGFAVTGYSPDVNGTNDIVTIAYDTNGKQLWLQRYTGVANYGAVGNAIAVDKSGNVYVAGYENVPGGGTEMVLIKYAPVTLQHQSNGNFLLQAQGAAREPFDIQASTNLQSWSDLGLQDANTNGLLQYLDTNTALYPYRFYLAIPEP